MTFDFFEGPAGTGKTHNLVERARELVQQGVLEGEQKVLALTFMNGARRRLDARLGESSAFQRRFACQTFDVFARALTARRRSLITAHMRQQTADLNEFDAPCALAGALLGDDVVRTWVARSFPLILIDEAQDLDEHRMHILQGLSRTGRIVAAADAFQCLHDGRDTLRLIGWLESAGHTHRLTLPRRTQQQGLLAAALAVRQGSNIKAALTASTFNERTIWNGEGFRLLETPAKAALLAWNISNEIAQRQGAVVVLTPDAGSAVVRAALEVVRNKPYRRRSGATFGPYPFTWENRDNEEADALLASIELPEHAAIADLRALMTPLAGNIAVTQALSRMDRLRRVQGQITFTAAQVRQCIRESVRTRARLGIPLGRRYVAMTIQQAKNREFSNVIILWPHTVTGGEEHLRRLLYNGITRARNHCAVIVLGRGRLDAPPFAPIGT